MIEAKRTTDSQTGEKKGPANPNEKNLLGKKILKQKKKMKRELKQKGRERSRRQR